MPQSTFNALRWSCLSHRILDKLVDELAKGRPLSKVLRDSAA